MGPVVGGFRLDNPLIMAPMAGVTHTLFRRLVAMHGAAMVVSEMISAEGLRRKDPGSFKYVTLDSSIPALQAFQLFGSEPASFEEAVKILEDLGAPVVDINAGCPVPKVVRKGAGAALLREPSRLYRIVERVKKTSTLPVTVKLRLGWDSGSINICEVAKNLEELGVAAITIHARTAKQLYSGQAQWEWIKKVKKDIRVPVIGNGDVGSLKDLLRMYGETGCDGIMIGRGALGNPWLFQAGAAHFRPDSVNPPPDDWSVFHGTAKAYIRLLAEAPEELSFLRNPAIIRKNLMWFSRGCPASSEFRGKINESKTVKEMLSAFDRWFEQVILKSNVSFLEAKKLIGES
ncbi:tRNA dihydrouridine synthase DusB [Thermodesulforhabdus norvegica]|uniref:tRNA-dihydrouridine synthase n=1 Tax=Thermodesulforhabdus norvegica TaxID=39841 RepID=A0A1I4SR02_9BACT|nr:tRNA dihydrouridine synthase DusB [Thermodesulforhabdus norvegica]SFM66958.1 putative TIM-barrel protein, nifR3 family [Thermodesulforhabdus norvegica]